MQAATTPLTLIASNRGSPWDRAECSLGKKPPVQLLPSVWYLFIPASVGVLLLWSFQSSQDLCWERAAPLRPVRRTADWHTQDHECLLGLTVHQLVSVIKRNQMEKCTMIGRSFIPEGYSNLPYFKKIKNKSQNITLQLILINHLKHYPAECKTDYPPLSTVSGFRLYISMITVILIMQIFSQFIKCADQNSLAPAKLMAQGLNLSFLLKF